MKYKIYFLILFIAVIAAGILYMTGPKAKKTIPNRPVPLVETVEIYPGREKIFVEAFGTVIPAKRITLQSEVEGRIIGQSPQLVPGGLIKEGDVVIRVDPSDYELLINQYRAEMQEAIYELDLEKGKQVIAEREWKLLEKEIDTIETGKSLALREPHLRLVKARVDKAKSKLDAAELALKRTTIKAPFNALVLEEFIDKGQLVSRQTHLAALAGTDQFWVQVSVPVSVLQRISLPEETGKKGSETQVVFESVNSTSVVRRGHVLRVMGDLDPEGRMARILININDPLNLNDGNAGQNKDSIQQIEEGRILLGSYVKVRLDAGFFEDIYSIPRQALREGDVIWVKDSQDKLQIRKVSVVWRRKDDVLVNVNLEDGDAVILSRLRSPLPGINIKDIKDKGERETNPDPLNSKPLNSGH